MSVERIPWAGLSAARKKELVAFAERIADRERERLRREYGGDFLGIGVGFRTKGSAPRLYKELVLRISVRRKWTRGEADEGTPIPESFAGYVTRNGRRVHLEIPTDVVGVEEFELQRTHVRVRGRRTEFGSLCCLLSEEPPRNGLFMLSCKHVFGLTAQTDRCQGIITAGIRLVDGPGSGMDSARVLRREDLARTHPVHPGTATAIFSLDAAIAGVQDSREVSSRINHKRAVKILEPSNVFLGDRVSVPARSAAIRGTIASITPKLTLPFRCNGNVYYLRFKRVIEYRVDRTSQRCPDASTRHRSPPCPGDSGSAVLRGDRLIGMHFGYNPATGHGYAMFVSDIVQRSTFGRTLELEPNHNL